MDKFYCGVGARKTPKKILNIMADVAIKLSEMGFILRSGRAEGPDTVFGDNAIKKEIYYPSDCTKESIAMAKKFHPTWDDLSMFGKKLHGRNPFQVLGRNLDDPVTFLLCWTPDGAINHNERSIKTGGTGTAISIADYFGVPVFNLKRDDHKRRIEEWIKK